MAVAVVERFEQKPFYGLSAGQESGRCREETISGGSSAYFTIKYRLASLIWYKHVFLVRIVSDVISRRGQVLLHANAN